MATVIHYRSNRMPAWNYFRTNESYLNYDDWLASVGAVLINFNEAFFSGIFYIKFENEEDAILFKLRYM